MSDVCESGVSGACDAGPDGGAVRQTMGLVALTAAVFAAGAYAGRHLSEGAAIVFFFFLRIFSGSRD